MITKNDLMLIEFSRDETSWTMQRSKHHSVSRMFLRERPQSVKFMVIVTDPRNVSTREIIKVSRDVTEATPLAYLARAPLELVPCPGWSEHLTSIPIKPPVLLLPRREKKPLIVETVGSAAINKNRSKEASSVKVDEVDKTSAAIVEPKDDRIDTIPEAAESQNDNVSKRERDETSRAKIDEVAEKENGEVPQACASTADVEQATEAPQQRQQQQLSAAAVRTSEDDAAQCVQQRTAEQVIDVPDDAGTSAQQRTVEQVVEVEDETTAVHPLDEEPLDETQRAERLVRAGGAPAREGTLARAVSS